jgi:hypothetical protein
LPERVADAAAAAGARHTEQRRNLAQIAGVLSWVVKRLGVRYAVRFDDRVTAQETSGDCGESRAC